MKKLLFIPLLFNFFWCLGQAESKIIKDDLPENIKVTLSKKYHGYSVSNIVKVINSDGAVTYKLEIKKESIGNGTITVSVFYMTYDTDGKTLSKIKDKEFYYTDSPRKNEPTPHSSDDGHNH